MTVSGSGGSRLSSSSSISDHNIQKKRRSSITSAGDNDDDDKLLDVVGPDTPHPGNHNHNHNNELNRGDREHSRDRDDRISERGEGSESSGSESGGGPSGPTTGCEGPRPDVSVGPPLRPPLLPCLYPPVPGLYPGPGPLLPPSHLGLHAGVTPGMLFNAQLALAASQHPALFAHYPHHLANPLHQLKGHRFSPYGLPSAPSHGSAFETVTPGSRGCGTLSPRSPPPRGPTGSPCSPASSSSVQQPLASSTGDLKSIENMVNGLQRKRRTVSPAAAASSSISISSAPSNVNRQIVVNPSSATTTVLDTDNRGSTSP